MQMFEMGGVYICASVGAAERIEEFKSIGLSDDDISRIQFITFLLCFSFAPIWRDLFRQKQQCATTQIQYGGSDAGENPS